mmetsp:Transcript_43025/g.121646  ORF Transcript_43025/g.121646 Transcript_43025/m.121646 type:complete len:381 (-) Transcript_43025:71-1213(-)
MHQAHMTPTRGSLPGPPIRVGHMASLFERPCLGDGSGKAMFEGDLSRIYSWLQRDDATSEGQDSQQGSIGSIGDESRDSQPGSLGSTGDESSDVGTWDTAKASFAGDVALVVEGRSPAEAFEALRRCLLAGAPLAAEVDNEDVRSLRLSAFIFQDFVPLRVEAQFGSAVDGSTVLTLKDIWKSDVVRFRQLCGEVALALTSVGVATHADKSGTSPFSMDSECGSPFFTKGFDDFDDFDDDCFAAPESWSDVLDPLCMQAFHAACPAIRAEGCQAIARRAHSTPECLKALADAFVHRFPDGLRRALSAAGPAAQALAEAYPVASALRLAAGCQAAAAVLESAGEAFLTTPSQSVLLQRELSKAMDISSATKNRGGVVAPQC